MKRSARVGVRVGTAAFLAVGVGLICAGLALGGAGPSGGGADTSPAGFGVGQPPPMESSDQVAQRHLSEANQSVAADNARAERGNQAFTQLQRSAPNRETRLRISLSQPIQLPAFARAAAANVLHVDTAFVWLSAPGAVNALWGEVALVPPPNAPAGAVDLDALRASYASRLQNHLLDVQEQVQQADPDSVDGLRAQADDLQADLRYLQNNGLQIFGFDCVCSPSALIQFREERNLPIRVVELADNQASAYPLAPEDGLRQRIIDSGGRYGQ